MSKSSSHRAKRRQLVKDLELECAQCGRKLKPTSVQYVDEYEAGLYGADCECGAHVEGALGPPEFVTFYESFMSGYLAGKGLEQPTAKLEPVPAAWYQGDVH